MALALEEKYDQVRQLINMGKERGYLLYDEVNDILPAEVHSSEEIDDLLSTFERYGIDIYEDVTAAKAARAQLEPAESTDAAEIVIKDEPAGSEEVELDLTPGLLEKTNDPVRMYLREMGTVPLLTREGEVAIAKRIERGQLLVLKTITRSPDRRQGTAGRRRGFAQGRALDQRDRAIRRRGADRREDREQDQADAQGSRQDRAALRRGAEGGRQAGKHAEVEEALLPARAQCAFADAHPHLATGALAGIQSVGAQAADRQDAAHGRAATVAGARSRKARAARRRLERRYGRRSAARIARAPHASCARFRMPARWDSPS